MSDFLFSLSEDNIIKIDDESVQPYIDTTTEEFEKLINELTYKLKEIEKDDLFNQMLSSIYNLMENKNMTYEESMVILDIPKEKQRRYIQGLNRKFNVDIDEEEEVSKHIYKMNPPFPNCHEEHMW